MPSDATAMLFAPPQPPVSLPREGEVVLGRSRECEVRLPDVDTSRRHAKIVCAGGRFVLHDLGSTNGTFVNGERIEQRELRAGDRLQIGANTVTFCQVSGGLDQPDDGAKTVLFERSLGGEVFRGDLAEIPPFAVLQLLEMGRKTGLLRIDSDAAPGRLWFRARRPGPRRDQEPGGLRRRGRARARDGGHASRSSRMRRRPRRRSRRR